MYDTKCMIQIVGKGVYLKCKTTYHDFKESISGSRISWK